MDSAILGPRCSYMDTFVMNDQVFYPTNMVQNHGALESQKGPHNLPSWSLTTILESASHAIRAVAQSTKACRMWIQNGTHGGAGAYKNAPKPALASGATSRSSRGASVCHDSEEVFRGWTTGYGCSVRRRSRCRGR